MQERRRLKRKYLAFFTRVFDQNSGELLGHLADITSEGLMLITTHPLPTDKEFTMNMDLPDNIFGRSQMDIHARSKWCQPDIDPAFFNTGFQFISTSPEMLETIQQIIVEYGIRD